MMFALHERPAAWVTEAPIRVDRELHLAGPPERAFDVLADWPGWTRWFRGMSKVEVEAPAGSDGAARVVTVGLTKVREKVVVWDRPHRFVLVMTASNAPGLRSMGEDWRLEADGDGTLLRFTAGMEAAGPLRLAPGLVRAIVARSVGGAAGLVEHLRATGD